MRLTRLLRWTPSVLVLSAMLPGPDLPREVTATGDKPTARARVRRVGWCDTPFDLSSPAQAVFTTTPMTIAVQWDVEDRIGRTGLGRASVWRLQDGVWWCQVLCELATHRAGIPAGWMDSARLRPGSHAIVTTHLSHDWAIWRPPLWPAALQKFAAAAWNEQEARRYRP